MCAGEISVLSASRASYKLRVLVFLFSIVTAATGQAAQLTVSCGALGLELQLCQEAVDSWSEATGHAVKVISTPNSTTERFSLYQQILASKSPDIDILQIDVIWPGILAPHLVDLSPFIGSEITNQHFPSLITNNTIDGRLVAMPLYTSAGVLYYRKDLLRKYGYSAPQSWQQLTHIARAIQRGEREAGNPRMQGFVFQAKGYEGLTCDALEWVASFGGGTLVSPEGSVTIDNVQAVAALELARSWIGDIAPKGVLNYAEEESRGVFQSGNAVFMRNWPYAWALGNSEGSAVRGKIGVKALPAGGDHGRPASVLGGWQLAVSRYSRHPELAADLVRYLTSYEQQKRRAIIGAYNPTITALYRDQEVLDAVPFFGDLYTSFSNAVARPSRVTRSKYTRVSAEFYYQVHDILAGGTEPGPGLRALQQKLERISGGREWQ